MKLYLDMDGTLVDFVSQVNKYGFWCEDKPEKMIFVLEPEDKADYAGPESYLVDDRKNLSSHLLLLAETQLSLSRTGATSRDINLTKTGLRQTNITCHSNRSWFDRESVFENSAMLFSCNLEFYLNHFQAFPVLLLNPTHSAY